MIIDDSPRYTQLLGGGVGGVARSEVPRVVANLLEERQGRAVEITVRPEALPESRHYTIEWQYLVYDQEALEWQPLDERPDDDRGG